MSYSKYRDINAVLSKAAEQLDKIETNYGNALHAKAIPDSLLVDIKDCLGNMRSALDYLACKLRPGDTTFPIANSMADFKGRSQGFPATVLPVMEAVQSYNGDTWLASFNLLSNKHKHVTLIPQSRTEVRETRVSAPCGGISWQGVTFEGDISVMGVPIDPRTQLPVPNRVVKTEVITWVHFMFDNSSLPSLPSGISALPFLKATFARVTRLVKDIESA